MGLVLVREERRGDFWGVGRVLGVVGKEEGEGVGRDDLTGEGADCIAGGCAKKDSDD